MKTTIRLFALGIITLAGSCSSSQHAGSSSTDDVYYSANDKQRVENQTTSDISSYKNESQVSESNDSQSENTSSDYSARSEDDYYSTTTTDETGNTYITNNYYEKDDYYDYSYSANLRRYYMPAYGYGYYDPFYTNLYWYDYNPVSWGVSIYMGYNWWAPSSYYYSPWYPSIGFSFGWGYPYYPYGYYPYYGYGSCGYSSYYYPYYNGCGYYNPCYYNSYDHYNSSVYYGPRGSVSSNSSRVATMRPERSSVGNLYEGAVLGGKVVATNPELPNKIRTNSVMNSSLDETKQTKTPGVKPTNTVNSGISDELPSTKSILKPSKELSSQGINPVNSSPSDEAKSNGVNKNNALQKSPVQEQQKSGVDSKPKVMGTPSNSEESIQTKTNIPSKQVNGNSKMDSNNSPVNGSSGVQSQEGLKNNSTGLQNNSDNQSNEMMPQQGSPSQRAGGNSQPSGSGVKRNSQLNERLKQYKDKVMQGQSPQSTSPAGSKQAGGDGSNYTEDRKPSKQLDQKNNETMNDGRKPRFTSPKESGKSIIRDSEQRGKGSKLDINTLFKNNNSRSSGSEFRAPSPSRSSGGGNREMRSPSSGPKR